MRSSDRPSKQPCNQERPWDDITAAITAFDLYHDRPWVTQVLQPFVVYHAAHILLNADDLVRMHRAWTKRAVAMAAPQAPGFVLSALKTLSGIDPVWAKQLATTAAATMPAAVWPHVDILLAVDRQWAEGILRQAAPATPYDAIRAVPSYITAPWGPQFFAEVVLREPRWVVSILTYSPAPVSSGAARARCRDAPRAAGPGRTGPQQLSRRDQRAHGRVRGGTCRADAVLRGGGAPQQRCADLFPHAGGAATCVTPLGSLVSLRTPWRRKPPR